MGPSLLLSLSWEPRLRTTAILPGRLVRPTQLPPAHRDLVAKALSLLFNLRPQVFQLAKGKEKWLRALPCNSHVLQLPGTAQTYNQPCRTRQAPGYTFPTETSTSRYQRAALSCTATKIPPHHPMTQNTSRFDILAVKSIFLLHSGTVTGCFTEQKKL